MRPEGSKGKASLTRALPAARTSRGRGTGGAGPCGCRRRIADRRPDARAARTGRGAAS